MVGARSIIMSNMSTKPFETDDGMSSIAHIRRMISMQNSFSKLASDEV